MTASDTESNGINLENALKIIQKDGILANFLKGFEPREEQQKMMSNVIEAYNRSKIALIEAGTGTGKSVAYLIPAILWSLLTKERTVISTHTITLQEQLIQKDIPLILKALNIDIRAELVKGMGNYVCLRKVQEAHQEFMLLTPQEQEELRRIDEWSQTTYDGSRSELPFFPTAGTWERVSAESDMCSWEECPYYNQCHFIKARRKAADAQILVANHTLLFSDLAMRGTEGDITAQGVLPGYSRVILDEAHHIEDIATEYFASEVNQLYILRTLSRLSADKQVKARGKLPVLEEKLYKIYGNQRPQEIESIRLRLITDIPGLRNELVKQIHDSFKAFENFLQQRGSAVESETSPAKENKLRLLSNHLQLSDWMEQVVLHAKKLIGQGNKYVQALCALTTDIAAVKNPKLQESTKSVCLEIDALANRLAETFATLEQFIGNKIPVDKVRWIESTLVKMQLNITLIDASLNVAEAMAKHLFNRYPTVVLCSATLTTNKKFDYYRSRMGLTDALVPNRVIKENIYDSPFDFKKQALFAIPTDMPDPSHPNFFKAANEKIWQAIQASRGNAFVLFTSYHMLTQCHQELSEKMQSQRYNVLKQGEANRQALLTSFKETPHSVLFGTDSFWEGVDVAGDALRCVIIVKLPFKVPTDPLVQARTEDISAKGGNPFMDFSVPQAIVKFKQGFGRLIRNKQDRGCVICLDPRLITKSYGKLFLNSLPNCQQITTQSTEIYQVMQDFYRKTHYLTTK